MSLYYVYICTHQNNVLSLHQNKKPTKTWGQHDKFCNETMTYQDIENLKLEDLYGALYCAGANANLIEVEDEAQWVFDDITRDGVNAYDLTPVEGEDNERFEDVCAMLDLNPTANNVKRVWGFAKYNEMATYVCFADEWESN